MENFFFKNVPNNGDKFVVRNAKVAYNNLEVPALFKGDDKEKYMITLLLPKNDPQVTRLLAQQEELKKIFAQETKKTFAPTFLNAFRDGDVPNTLGETPEYKQGYYEIKVKKRSNNDAKSLFKDRFGRSMDPSVVTNGSLIDIEFQAFIYHEGKVGKGMSTLVNMIKFVKQDEPFALGSTEPSLLSFDKPEDEDSSVL